MSRSDRAPPEIRGLAMIKAMPMHLETAAIHEGF